jgi:HD-like signal output (HDOD) protein
MAAGPNPPRSDASAKPDAQTDRTPAETVERNDPALRKICALMDREIAGERLQIPQRPNAAKSILDLSINPDVSIEDVIRQVRTDPVLAGRIIEIANSATYSGVQPAQSLKMAVIRLGLNKVNEVALELSLNRKDYRDDKRSRLLTQLWEYSLGTGLAAEELANELPEQPLEGAFLAGLLHDVASPAIVKVVGRLEGARRITPQIETRVLGFLSLASSEFTAKIARSWNLPEPVQEAIRLQDRGFRDRRRRPLAQLLVCAKEVAADLGLGTHPAPIDFKRCRDFRLLQLNDAKILGSVRSAVLDKMEIASTA